MCYDGGVVGLKIGLFVDAFTDRINSGPAIVPFSFVFVISTKAF